MTIHLRKGRYAVRFADGAADIAACQALRHACFIGSGAGRDVDGFDALCQHMMIETADGRLVCTYRVMLLQSGADINDSYAAQYYDLQRLSRFSGPMVELGRFCVDAGVVDADVLRVAWAALTRFVDGTGAQMLFGCSSFAGCDVGPHEGALALLRDRHVAPVAWLPGIKADEVLPLGDLVAGPRRDAIRAMPPLLKTYLAMGGWVSDHAVVDRQMQTLHVFTGLEIAAIPAPRARALRTVAAGDV